MALNAFDDFHYVLVE